MSDEREKLNQLSEIIDVEFLPVLDDEDYKREKINESALPNEMAIAVQEEAANLKEKAPNLNEKIHLEKTEEVREQVQDNVLKEQEVLTREDKGTNSYNEEKKHIAREYEETGDRSRYTHKSQSSHTQNQQAYSKNEQGYTQAQNGYTQAQNGYTQAQNGYTQEVKQDTSYASYDEARKQAFRKKKKKFGASLLGGIGMALAILVGFPIVLGVGTGAMFIIGMGIFFSVLALGMGILGLGMAGFTAAAGVGSMGALFLFGSLVALGGGGLGCCILILIFIGIKNIFVGARQRRRLKREREEA